MKHKETQWKASDGLVLFGQYWQPDGETKAVVCLVHGLGEHSTRYGHVAEFLANNGYATIAFDQRGHGKSAGQRGHVSSFEQLMTDIDELLSQAKKYFPQKPLFLFGHSMGGNLVLNYGIRKKPKLNGIIASGAYLRLAFPTPQFKLMLGKIFSNIFPTLPQPSGLDTKAISRDPEEVKKYQNDPLVHDRVTTRFIEVHLAGEWALEHAADLNLPLLVLHGTADRITSHLASKEFAEKVKEDITLKLMEGSYHEMHNDYDREVMMKELKEWMDKHLGN